jgi:hypothetical protein
MSHAGHGFKTSSTKDMEGGSSATGIREMIEVRESFNQIQIQLQQLRQMYYGLDLYAALATQIHEVKKGILDLSREFEEIQLDIKGLRRIVTIFYTDEVLEHQKAIDQYQRELQGQKLDFSLLSLQAETTIGTLRAQNRSLQREYQSENLRTAMQLRFRINQLQTGSVEPETLTVLDNLVARLSTSISDLHREFEPVSPVNLGNQTNPGSPRLLPRGLPSIRRDGEPQSH